MHGDSLLMLTTKVVSNKKPPLLSDSESGGSTSRAKKSARYRTYTSMLPVKKRCSDELHLFFVPV